MEQVYVALFQKLLALLPQRFTVRFGGREGGEVNSQKLKKRIVKFTIHDLFDFRF
jgi:hypothetical protein